MDLEQEVSALVESGMPMRQAEVYALRELEDISRQETAERLDISPNTVDEQYASAKSHVSKAVDLVNFIDSEVGGVLEWIETLRETDHPEHDDPELDNEEFVEYWENYPSVPGGR